MNVEIGAEAALFPEKEYIKGIFVAVHGTPVSSTHSSIFRLSAKQLHHFCPLLCPPPISFPSPLFPNSSLTPNRNPSKHHQLLYLIILSPYCLIGMNLLEEQVGGGKRGVGEQVQEAQRQEGEDVFYANNNKFLLLKAQCQKEEDVFL